MPSKTKSQMRLMTACAGPKSRKKMKADCPPMDVAKEFRHMDTKLKKSKKKS